MDDFDREFGFDELVPEKVIKSMIPFLKRMGAEGIAVFLSDFSLYFSDQFSDPSHIDKVRSALKNITKTQCGKVKMADSHALYFPIFNEGEAIAFLVLKIKGKQIDKTSALVNAGFLLVNMVANYIEMKQKVIMTTDLHKMVVEDSFQQVKDKNEKLAKSERKYRRLAHHLEEEVKKQTQEIKDQQTRLLHNDKMASVGQLAAGVAHEINNPVGFISSNLDTFKGYVHDLNSLIDPYRKLLPLVAEDDVAKNKARISSLVSTIHDIEDEIDVEYVLEDIDELLNDSMNGIGRIKKIVKTLKDFAHPGKIKPELADINQSIESTLSMVHKEIKHKAEVIKEYGKLPSLYCYPRQLNQVFMNIILNAAQSIKVSGTIAIKTDQRDNNIIIQIGDTGTGIPEENLKKIFDPFFTTKDIGQGTGMGLNLAYSIIKTHEGSITATSAMGEGTEFTITLPIYSGLSKNREG